MPRCYCTHPEPIVSRRSVRVALPRPPGTRRSTPRAELVISMHPRKLASLQARARAVGMSLTAYVDALLESDGEDVPAVSDSIERAARRELARNPRPSLLREHLEETAVDGGAAASGRFAARRLLGGGDG